MRKTISSLDELCEGCILHFGGREWSYTCKAKSMVGYIFDGPIWKPEELADFIRWGAITKPVEPRTFEGWIHAAAFSGDTGHGVYAHQRCNAAVRVLVTEILTEAQEDGAKKT